jgi:hypothetical protein
VYESVDNVWSYKSKLYPDDGYYDERFAVSVAMYETTAMIGSYNDDGVDSQTGNYLFRYIITWHSLESYIIFVYNTMYSMYLGSVYLYRSVSNEWSCQSKIISSDGYFYDGFGVAISIYGNTALIGAFADDDKAADAGKFQYQYIIIKYYINIYHNVLYFIGSVYSYIAVDGFWSFRSKLYADDGINYNIFGRGISIYGTKAVIDAERNSNTGMFYYINVYN